MRRMICALLLLLLAQGTPAQKPDPRKIAVLEKKVAGLEGDLLESTKNLRSLFKKIKNDVDEAGLDDGAKLCAELVRVLEPVLNDARSMAATKTESNRRVVMTHLEKEVPTALAKMEREGLVIMKTLLQQRIMAILQEAGDVLEGVSHLTDSDLAKRALKELIDHQVPFEMRWNSLLSGKLEQAVAFRNLRHGLKTARQDLAVARDPLVKWQIGAPKGYARVPSGSYTLISTDGFVGDAHRRKPRKFTLSNDVFIGLYEVTTRDFAAWLNGLALEDQNRHVPKDGGNKPLWPRDEEKGAFTPPPDALDLPIVGVEFWTALTYAKAQRARLPTENEWCAAAAGPKQLRYPWGKEWAPNLANDRDAGLDSLQPVGKYPDGRGPFGHYDLAGNASEWTLTYESGKELDPNAVPTQGNIAVRGGSFRQPKDKVVCGWFWFHRSVHDRSDTLGFRLARDRADDPPK